MLGASEPASVSARKCGPSPIRRRIFPPLASLYGHAEEPLVEVQRAFQVRYGERYVVQPANTKGSGLSLGKQTPSEGQPRKGEKQASAGQRACCSGRILVLAFVAQCSVTPLR